MRNWSLADLWPRLAGPAEARVAATDALPHWRCLKAEPKQQGSVERGRALSRGVYSADGEEIEIPDGDIWNLAALRAELHGFAWLDDLAAYRGSDAVALAKRWVFDWMRGRTGGQEAAWLPHIAGRRVVRLRHAEFMLLAMAGTGERAEFAESIRLHARRLRKLHGNATVGLPRVEALAGLLYAELSTGGRLRSAQDAARRLGETGRTLIVPDKGLDSRNPEELLGIACLLDWCAALLASAGCLAPRALIDTIGESVSILRLLRHADGSLARFQGGGNPDPGRLDRLLASRPGAVPALAMGYARMASGGVSVIVDAAAPLTGWNSHSAHASTAAFEMVSGRCPMVVNMGPGAGFDAETQRRARATGAHSTVEIDAQSSSRLSAPVLQKAGREEIIVVCPDDIRIEQLPGDEGVTVIVSHNGYVPLFGLTHLRRLDLRPDGGRLWAEDTIWARSDEDRLVFDGALAGTGRSNLPFALRFHMHPDCGLKQLGVKEVGISLANGEMWRFRLEGAAQPTLEPSRYLDEGSGRICDSRQIVCYAEFEKGTAQLRWEIERVANG